MPLTVVINNALDFERELASTPQLMFVQIERESTNNVFQF
jgi:hypothetical protein